jgi:hypothetical protein
MTHEAIISFLLSLTGVLLVGVLVPIYLISRSSKERRDDLAEAARQHREDRDAEWARQDEVARRAEQAARDLAASQQKIAAQAAEAAALLLGKQEASVTAQREVARQAAVAAELLVANNEQVAAGQLETSRKLDTIHTLVNSNMTAAMQSEFEAVVRELAVMREIMELRRVSGQEPTQDTLSAIASTETKMHELDAALADRAKAQAKVEGTSGLDIVTTTSYRATGAGGEA